jgi:hypothetical protein
MEKILKYLDCIPLKSFAGGYLNNGIIDKDCIIMSKDVGQLVSSNFSSLNISDNSIISNVIKLSGVELSDLECYIPENSDTIDKLYINDKYDIDYIINLLKNIYNING